MKRPGNERPLGMDDAERAVAVLDRPDLDAEREDVGQLLERDLLALGLLVDRVGPLLAPLHHRLDAALLQPLREVALDLGDQRAVAPLQPFEAPHDGLVVLGLQLVEGQVLELLAHVLHAHAAGERRIDVQRLLGDPRALVCLHEMQGAHVVEAVGELDEQHPDVLDDGEQQLAQVLGLLGLLRDEVELLDLGQALDQRGDLLAEPLLDLDSRRVGILDRVVQQRGGDGGIVELQLGQQRGDLKRDERNTGRRRPASALRAAAWHRRRRR